MEKVAEVAIGDAGDTHLMGALAEVCDAGGTGETDRMNACSKVVEAGGDIDRVGGWVAGGRDDVPQRRHCFLRLKRSQSLGKLEGRSRSCSSSEF